MVTNKKALHPNKDEMLKIPRYHLDYKSEDLPLHALTQLTEFLTIHFRNPTHRLPSKPSHKVLTPNELLSKM